MGLVQGNVWACQGNVWGVSMDQKFLKDTPPVLQLFFSSACRILLDLWTFSPVGARARSRRICMCARARVPLTTNIKNLTTSRDFSPRGARARILSEAFA